MKPLKIFLWTFVAVVALLIAGAALVAFFFQSSNAKESAPTSVVVYTAPCGVSLKVNINPNWLEGDALSFDFDYNEKLLSPNLIPTFPTWSQPEQPIETRSMSNGTFEVNVLARGTSQSDFESAAQCIADHLTQFNDALATLGSHLPQKDRSFYTPYAIKSLVYVP